jgi:hypothetical protein
MTMAVFLAGLLLKIAMTASIVVAASIVVERSGPFVGALIASLPTAGGAALIILAIQHPPSFIAASAVGSMVANAAVAVFALTYAALAQKRSLVVSLGVAFLAWLSCAAASRLVDWTAAEAIVLNAIVYPVAIVAGRRFRAEGTIKRVAFTAVDLAWRAGVVTLCVIVVTTASSSIGSYFSGVFAFFPVAMGSFFVILHPRIGGPNTASVAAHALTPLIGLGLSLLIVHLLAEPVGVWWSYALGLSTGVGWNTMLWALRHRRLRAA